MRDGSDKISRVKLAFPCESLQGKGKSWNSGDGILTRPIS